jgi:hypothetical protein
MISPGAAIRLGLAGMLAVFLLGGCDAGPPATPPAAAPSASDSAASDPTLPLVEFEQQYKAPLGTESLKLTAITGAKGILAWVDRTKVWLDRRIPVCWEEMPASQSTEREWVKDALAASWQYYSEVQFLEFDQCKPGDPGIHVKFGKGRAQTLGLGTDLDGVSNGLRLNIGYSDWQTWCADPKLRENCLRANAVHEFGHGLGFVHEHNRHEGRPAYCNEKPERTVGNDTFGTPWDPKSIMNYCNEERMLEGGKLSEYDIEAAQKLYGAIR